VAAAVDQEVASERESRSYKRWKEVQAKEKADPAPMGHRHNAPDDWYGYLNMMEASAVTAQPKQTVGEAIAEVWFSKWPGGSEAETIGWLIGRRPDKAADHARNKYQTGMMIENPPPPLEWIMDVFTKAWPAMEKDQRFRDALDRSASLFELIKDAEKDLDVGLRKIQKKYGGGDPIV
jgi:hypothetical protein